RPREVGSMRGACGFGTPPVEITASRLGMLGGSPSHVTRPVMVPHFAGSNAVLSSAAGAAGSSTGQSSGVGRQPARTATATATRQRTDGRMGRVCLWKEPGGGPPMQVIAKSSYVVRLLSDVPSVPCPCGTSTRPLTAADGGPCSLHVTEIRD